MSSLLILVHSNAVSGVGGAFGDHFGALLLFTPNVSSLYFNVSKPLSGDLNVWKLFLAVRKQFLFFQMG